LKRWVVKRSTKIDQLGGGVDITSLKSAQVKSNQGSQIHSN